MPDYSKGKIYSIRFYDNDKLIYIGSTIQTLSKRFGGHKTNLRCSLYQYIQENYNGDFKCCYIELLEPFECNNKNELDRKEGELIRKIKTDDNYTVINKQIAGRNRKEYRQENADNIKKYYQDNKDKLNEKQKQYYQDNKDKLNEKHKQYHQDNKDKLNEKQKQYNKDNIDKIKERNKQYNKDNIDKIKEKNKQYYLKKKAEAAAAAANK
jgi:hypothetical protein